MSTPYPPPPCSTGKGDTPTPARTVPLTVPRLARTLLDADEFLAVAMTVARDNPGIGWSLAERIAVEALAFVATCSEKGNVALAPSPVVDEGWHALILHTKLYADLQERLGGALVHHYPQAPEDGEYDADIIGDTLTAMRRAGFEPDEELWRSPMENLIQVQAQTWHSPVCGIKPMPTPQCLSDPKKTPTR
ncbi:hypothetical protein AB0B78_00415 [Streptomyces sp. NPDC040724]|uniref:glycine-rich domain-containing protein n=1 Tax=Streptomyces sp. NPDC040724 TaxID=3155612 RepID=UPI00340DF6F6